MDAVSGLLDGPRAREAFVLRSSMDPPWSLRIEDAAPLSVIGVVRGEAWITPDGGEAVLLRTGDVAIARGPEHYTVTDEPGRPWMAKILPGQLCVTPDGQELKAMSDVGIRTWGNSPDGKTIMVTGTYQAASEISHRLLAALPGLLTVDGTSLRAPLVGYLAEEVAQDQPGQEAVLDRLLDLLLIAVLRAWFARPDASAPGWYRAYGDPVVGPALRLMQHDPGHPWTLAELAGQAGASRAALARRFRDQVGEPPMAFLTHWRLSLAADLLREPGSTVASVARRVGYGSAFALSAAFTRERGMSPAEHRRRAAGDAGRATSAHVSPDSAPARPASGT